MEDLAFLSAGQQARLIAAGELSSVELVETYLRRIELLDGPLRSFVTVCADESLAQAREPGPAPLSGVPIPIKDLDGHRRDRTTFSCRAFADNVPEYDAGGRPESEGRRPIVIGKTNTPEFGTIPVTESELNGACRNPWDLAHARRIERRRGGRGRRGARAGGARDRRRRLDPHPVLLLRSLRPQALARAGLAGAVRARARGLGTVRAARRAPCATPLAARRMSAPSRATATSLPPPDRPFAERSRRRRARCGSPSRRTPPAEHPVDPACARRSSTPPRCSPSSGTRSREADAALARPGSCLAHFVRVWQVGARNPGVDDLTLLEPINRQCSRAARETPSPSTSPRHRFSAREGASRSGRTRRRRDADARAATCPIGWTSRTRRRAARSPADALTPFTPLVNVTGQPAMSVPLHWNEDLPIGIQLIGPPEGDGLFLLRPRSSRRRAPGSGGARRTPRTRRVFEDRPQAHRPPHRRASRRRSTPRAWSRGSRPQPARRSCFDVPASLRPTSRASSCVLRGRRAICRSIRRRVGSPGDRG